MNNIPEKVNEVLKQYFNLIESKLPGLLEGYYLYGSSSLKAFKDEFSDIDFIAVISRKATEADIDVLKEIHSDMQKKYPKPILDGMYITKDDIESLNKCESSCLRFNDGKFLGFKKFDRNSIDAYQLKKYGITIKGQDIKNYNYEVNWDILISNMRDNLNTYWLNWVNGCRRFPSIKYLGLFISLGMIEWGVLGISRLYYTFSEGDMTSKVGAGEYALRTVPQKWHRIINESMRLRKGIGKSYYRSIFERRNDALDYIEFIIQESNNLFKEKK
ncbi:MAG: aminoglycoside adenylyltransferase domain-containing protein [Caulobacteraceae bacterium]